MLLSRPSGTDRVQFLAAQLGCSVGEFSAAFGRMKPALLGSVSGHASVLAEFGGRFEQRERVYVFANWPTLEAALQHIVDERNTVRLSGPDAEPKSSSVPARGQR
ncbi:hypothetical protein [Variovorax sp. EBFNA2]|uniref:hypothetical protein n=1 Tax=Variovorax sp. EBFNA2 TaxID=3342097 RepID=UPI0029C0FB90|nr:hypothetical protein [Variovorax boronicumulans]WPG41028.1 hypothetical protein RZE79_33605 [Variovorax boronicumulans]